MYAIPMSCLASSPPDSIGTPPLLPSDPQADPASGHSSSDMDPPTSPLCASTSTMPPPESDSCGPSIFDQLLLAGGEDSGAADGLGMSFATSEAELAAFAGLDYLKGPEFADISFTDSADDSFRMWGSEY
jgi:hypothetical protein